MADYTKNEDYAAKDALASGDAEKLILGTDIGGELDEIQSAIASKYDSTDLASQAQAEAGLSHAVLMTPLRVAQLINPAAGAGIVGDLADLVDPGADRILFWDDSAGEAAFLTAGAGLTITDTTLTADATAIDHDSLAGYVADEHIAHSGVSITAGEGLSGGGTIAASRSLALAIASLTAESTLDLALDQAVFYDASATAHRKVPLATLVGLDLGDGKWYRSSTQALSAATEATVVFNAAAADNLERGAFSTSTGVYTAGSDGARLLVNAQITITALPSGATIELMIEAPGTSEIARSKDRNDADSTAAEISINCTAIVTLAASETMTVRAEASSGVNIASGVQSAFVNIVELG